MSQSGVLQDLENDIEEEPISTRTRSKKNYDSFIEIDDSEQEGSDLEDT